MCGSAEVLSVDWLNLTAKLSIDTVGAKKFCEVSLQIARLLTKVNEFEHLKELLAAA